MGVTLKDVAREAQMSTATASRVINGHGNGVLLPNLYGEFFSEIIRGTAETPVVLMNTPVRGYGHSAFCVGRVSMTFPWRAS